MNGANLSLQQLPPSPHQNKNFWPPPAKNFLKLLASLTPPPPQAGGGGGGGGGGACHDHLTQYSIFPTFVLFTRVALPADKFSVTPLPADKFEWNNKNASLNILIS